MTSRPDDTEFETPEDDGVQLLDLLLPLLAHWKLLVFGSLAAGLLALGVAFIVPVTYTARTTMLPPQQQQSGLTAALQSLGGLAGLAGAGGSLKSPADQYVALMQSVNATDRMVDQFDLMRVYKADYRFQARNALEAHTRITIGKKDGLITIEVDDHEAQRAADLANTYVEELKRLTSVLAVSEAQQRRAFFEKELKEARDNLAKAQKALQATGFDVAAMRAEPKAAAESYARLKAQITSAEVRAQVLRSTLADGAPELRQQLDELAALRSQLARLEAASEKGEATDYISNYREFKYREALFELFARQYELARVDESREGALIQVVDPATTPEYKSKPKRALMAVGSTFVAFMLLAVFVLIRHKWREAGRDPAAAPEVARLRAALGR
ncbi:MAG: lipopolysaccharide biosynthesis protein [Proteobacteria bacterium]|nr:lipopolysaccharide biosynthesis protein [Pseudomonadota bacterium]